MKQIPIIAIICIFITVSAAAAANAGAPIGVDIAKGKAQEFINTPDETVQYQKTENLNLGDYYIFNTGEGQVYVNAYTGTVERASFSHAQKDSHDIRLDPAEAEAVAMVYAGEKYGGFAGKNMQLVESNLLSHGDAGSEYTYVWREEVDGVLTPNTVVVSLDPGSGDVTSYIGIQREIRCPLEPKVTRDEALNIAAGQFPKIRVTDATADLSIEYTQPGMQALTWVVTMKGEPEDYVLQGGLVVIDAQTGDVLMMSPYL
ncbi:hypothetical protein FGU65_07705 [Methanoculleus sp. FWC-SCC1]|uniref:Peptidase propeptide and YPEB domain-containing protein n=1 Tax=Methanoculleus frigidifontis TaxID=2584085 RepID=A0ABT8MA35_9EURY|nr:hypothetical protein [Methanoculleus sp. FWC-SCC1]MDN7024770.1 hypothetical protein [Methanoculleus sp. FWC-SCC1]